MSTESKDIFKQLVETGTTSFHSYVFLPRRSCEYMTMGLCKIVLASIHPDFIS